jgi:hypothetical protein
MKKLKTFNISVGPQAGMLKNILNVFLVGF